MTDGTPDMRTIRRVLPYLWPRGDGSIRIRVVAAMGMLILSKVATVTTPMLFGLGVDQLAPTEEGIDVLLLGAVGLVLAYGLARLGGVGFAQLRDVIFARVAQRALRLLALETFQHIHALSMRFHISRKTGALNRVIERGVKGVEFLLRFLLFSIGPLVIELLMIAIVLWIMLDFSYLVVVVLTIALYIVFTFRVTEWRVEIRKRMNERDMDANQKAVDSLLNFETVKYFNAEKREAKRYDNSMEGYEKASLETSWSLAFLNFGQSVIITAGLVIVMVMAARGVQAGVLTVGDFVMVNAYMIQITMPLNFLGTVYREIRQSLIDMRDMFVLLDQPAEVIDRPGAKPLSVSHGEIVFDKVNFGYDDDRAILREFSMRVGPGETVAVVGPSGSGKSTLGRLLFRFYDVSGGTVTIDGQELRDVTQESVREAIGVVPQDTVLFNDTIYYNIAYGRDGATREEVEEAARAAQIHEFIESLPLGYETQVGERGLKLSGGEKQRVGIARTILKNPPILILDEATSALDTETEGEIKGSLMKMGANRSVIMIAHRLSTVVEADRIVVLEKGEVVESGGHDELLNKAGRYARLWQMQGADAEEAA